MDGRRCLESTVTQAHWQAASRSAAQASKLSSGFMAIAANRRASDRASDPGPRAVSSSVTVTVTDNFELEACQ